MGTGKKKCFITYQFLSHFIDKKKKLKKKLVEANHFEKTHSF